METHPLHLLSTISSVLTSSYDFSCLTLRPLDPDSKLRDPVLRDETLYSLDLIYWIVQKTETLSQRCLSWIFKKNKKKQKTNLVF